MCRRECHYGAQAPSAIVAERANMRPAVLVAHHSKGIAYLGLTAREPEGVRVAGRVGEEWGSCRGRKEDGCGGADGLAGLRGRDGIQRVGAVPTDDRLPASTSLCFWLCLLYAWLCLAMFGYAWLCLAVRQPSVL